MTRASDISSKRDKFFNSSLNGPKLRANEPYETRISELTQDRIRRQPFSNMKAKIDRIRINTGGSALSSGTSSATTVNHLAVRPFARTALGK